MANKSFLELLKVSFFLSKKNISRNKKTVFLVLVIISFGFISSIIIKGMLEDVKFDSEQNFIDVSFGHIILEPLDKEDKIYNINNIIKKIDSLPNIGGIVSVQKKAAKLYDSKDNYINSEILIVNPVNFGKVSSVDDLIIQGDFLNENSYNEIFSGTTNIKGFSDKRGINNIDVDIGKKIKVIFSGGEKNDFILQGIYKHRFEQVSNLILINEKTAKKIFDNYNSNEADFILIKLSNRDLTDPTIKELSYLGVNAKIIDWREKSAFFIDMLNGFSVVGDLSFLIGVIISAFSVYIILYINILHNRAQIGILKAVGISSKIISFSYILQALFYGVIGSILGILLTYLLIGYFMINPIFTEIGDLSPLVTPGIFMMVSFSIILASVITGYVVSRKIIKQNILESILNG